MMGAASALGNAVFEKFGWRDEVTVWQHERGLLYRRGRLTKILEPGQYRFWSWEDVKVTKVSIRQTSEVLTGQEILTSDKVEVRVSLIAQYTVTDPLLAVSAVESYTEQLYQDLQLALRTAVAGRTIESLLAAREEIGGELLATVAPAALAYGVTLKRIGVRDVVLPGVVRTVFLREIEADRNGRADLIKARHELATARARANTAKVLSDNPNVVRMKELDAIVSLAGKQGNVVLLPDVANMLVPRSMLRDDDDR